MISKIGATATLVGLLAATFGSSYVLHHGLPALRSTLGLSSSAALSLAASSDEPKFKVAYGYYMVPAFDCPGGHCQQPETKRLKVQSLNEGPVEVKDLVVNDRPECAFWGPKGSTMKFGDVSYVIVPCEPIRVRIATDKGEVVYDME
jgi:hypothetical protein